jgi:hypothetical protein
MSDRDDELRHNYLKRSEAARTASDRENAEPALAKAKRALQPKQQPEEQERES